MFFIPSFILILILLLSSSSPWTSYWENVLGVYCMYRVVKVFHKLTTLIFWTTLIWSSESFTSWPILATRDCTSKTGWAADTVFTRWGCRDRFSIQVRHRINWTNYMGKRMIERRFQEEHIKWLFPLATLLLHIYYSFSCVTKLIKTMQKNRIIHTSNNWKRMNCVIIKWQV